MFKHDAAIQSTAATINQPGKQLNGDAFIREVSAFKGKKIIQTLCIEGEYNGVQFSNITDAEVYALIQAYKQIQPYEVVLYGIQSDTPIQSLHKVSKEKLEEIAKKIEQAGIKLSLIHI